mgnify:CR=1 FL=1
MIQEFEFKDHEEWLAIRSKYIGGSDAGAVIGLNPYKSRYSLWAEKTGKVPGFEGNIATKVGSYLEELVAKMFEEETGKKVRRKNRTMVNDIYPFACANIDRAVIGEKALLEIKTTTSIPIMKQLRNTEFPAAYYAQVVHYLAVTGLEKAYLAVLVNCRELKIFTLDRDQAEIDALMEAEKAFWEYVEKDIEPGVDGSDATSDAILARYPESTDKNVDLIGYETELMEYMELSKRIKELTALKDEKANIIKDFMREAGSGTSRDYKVSYKTSSRKTFDDKKFHEEHGSINLEPYYKVSSSRRFTVTKKGE